ncbi:hypothetical protein FQZ97_568710 [compost metagenome]
MARVTAVLGAASARDKPWATTWLVPNTLVSTGVAITAPPTPNRPPAAPATPPSAPSQGQGWRSSLLAWALAMNIRATL